MGKVHDLALKPRVNKGRLSIEVASYGSSSYAIVRLMKRRTKSCLRASRASKK